MVDFLRMLNTKKIIRNIKENKNWLIYFLSIIVAMIFFSYLGFNTKQDIAVVLILALVLGTVMFWEIRLSFALFGVAVLFTSGLLSVNKFIEFSSLNIIIFLAGMMIFVGYLEKNAFFEYLINKLILLIGGGGKRIIFLLMILSGIFAAMVDEVTSILFMLSITLYLTARLQVNPLPFVMLIVFATNIGSSATAIGNPVGVMIALSAHLSFFDFLVNATPISFVSLLVCIGVSYLYFRKEIDEFAEKARKIALSGLVESHEADNKTKTSAILFIVVFSLLILHAQIEDMLGLEKNAMLLGTALSVSGLVLALEGKNAKHFVETKVDWWTLFFFIMLFASVGVLEETGVMEIMTRWFIQLFGMNKALAMLATIGLSGILSAFLDNVLAVAVFIPLIHDLQASQIGGTYLWWSLLISATFFGNLTIIGSTANIVALGLIEKRGLPKISFIEWFKAGLIVVTATVLTASLLLYLTHVG